jgi:hypothetical protein
MLGKLSQENGIRGKSFGLYLVSWDDELGWKDT